MRKKRSTVKSDVFWLVADIYSLTHDLGLLCFNKSLKICYKHHNLKCNMLFTLLVSAEIDLFFYTEVQLLYGCIPPDHSASHPAFVTAPSPTTSTPSAACEFDEYLQKCILVNNECYYMNYK